MRSSLILNDVRETELVSLREKLLREGGINMSTREHYP